MDTEKLLGHHKKEFELIQSFLSQSKIGSFSIHPNPDGGMKITIAKTNITIEKGCEPFFYGRDDQVSNDEHWYVFANGSMYVGGGFLSYQDAILTALKKRKADLDAETQVVKDCWNETYTAMELRLQSLNQKLLNND